MPPALFAHRMQPLCQVLSVPCRNMQATAECCTIINLSQGQNARSPAHPFIQLWTAWDIYLPYYACQHHQLRNDSPTHLRDLWAVTGCLMRPSCCSDARCSLAGRSMPVQTCRCGWVGIWRQILCGCYTLYVGTCAKYMTDTYL